MIDNYAAVQNKLGEPLTIQKAAQPHPGEDDIVIRNEAWAVNPADAMLQDFIPPPLAHLKHPLILGSDVAGVVMEVGSSVTRFKKGDRVVGLATGIMNNSPQACGFQNYTVVKQELTSKIPSSLPYTEACVLPLGLATSGAALFGQGLLGLQYPTYPPQASTGKTILIWGGASSVGANGIQLVVAAGYQVVTTCSSKNFDLVKALGASLAVDYNSATAENDIIAYLQDKDFAGAFAAAVAGRKFVASSQFVTEETHKLAPNVQAKFVESSFVESGDFGRAIFLEFLPESLDAGTYRCLPEPQMIGKGLSEIQKGIDQLKKGVSAKKMVIEV